MKQVTPASEIQTNEGSEGEEVGWRFSPPPAWGTRRLFSVSLRSVRRLFPVPFPSLCPADRGESDRDGQREVGVREVTPHADLRASGVHGHGHGTGSMDMDMGLDMSEICHNKAKPKWKQIIMCQVVVNRVCSTHSGLQRSHVHSRTHTLARARTHTRALARTLHSRQFHSLSRCTQA